MKVAIDKNMISQIKDLNEYDYICVFETATIEELKHLGIHCMRKDTLQEVDINLTDYDIDCLKKAKITDKDWFKKPELKQNKFAIIIPNCNYAEYLTTCIGSIQEQTYQNYEIIFIDDCSTDNSVEIAKKLLKPTDKIVELKQKRYNGGARNEGYLHISEDTDYVLYMDSDDWYRNNNVLEKINKNLQSKPDVLFIGLAQYIGGRTMDAYSPDYKDKYEAIEGWSGSCGKVIKRKLATRQECLYNEGTLKEDKNQHCRICIYMESFKCMKDCVYVWNRTNTKSVTTIRDKTIWGTSTIRHYADTLQLQLEQKGKDKKIDQFLEERVRKTKHELDKGGDQQW